VRSQPPSLGGLVASATLAAALAVGCAEAPPPAPRAPYAPPPSYGLPGTNGAPRPASPGAATAVAFARSRLGAPYCWGGTGPSCYDCSGLTQAAWWAAGKAIPRTSAAQGSLLPEVPLDRLEPGDILWRPGHVALYVGDGLLVTAPHEGGVVKLAPAQHYVKAVRP
jgi:cell wall-associated NlpC family hydrolase